MKNVAPPRPRPPGNIVIFEYDTWNIYLPFDVRSYADHRINPWKKAELRENRKIEVEQGSTTVFMQLARQLF